MMPTARPTCASCCLLSWLAECRAVTWPIWWATTPASCASALRGGQMTRVAWRQRQGGAETTSWMLNTLLASNRITMHDIKEGRFPPTAGGPMARSWPLLFVSLIAPAAAVGQQRVPDAPWPAYGGDVFGTRYS